MPSQETCFVIMPIGDQEFNGIKVSANDLKKKYSDLIKESIQVARPGIEVIRADEIEHSGTITTDIFTRIMKCDFVVADVTYPNPNVFYELGLRHACKSGTIILKETCGPSIPFDIVHLRHIAYENTASGLKDLAIRLKAFFDNHDRDRSRPDNNFLDIAKLIEFEFPYYKKDAPEDPNMAMLNVVFENPQLLDLLARGAGGEAVDKGEVIRAFMQNPQAMLAAMKLGVASGNIDLFSKNKKTTTE